MITRYNVLKWLLLYNTVCGYYHRNLQNIKKIKRYSLKKSAVSFLVCRRAKTIKSVFPFRAKVVPQGYLMKSSIIETDIS